MDLIANTEASDLQDMSDGGSSADDEGKENDPEELEIDEMSDDEDDRRARELLQAAPVRVNTSEGTAPMLLPYDNYMFAVRPVITLQADHGD